MKIRMMNRIQPWQIQNYLMVFYHSSVNRHIRRILCTYYTKQAKMHCIFRNKGTQKREYVILVKL